MMTRQVGRALAAQLDRVNQSPDRLRERNAELEQANESLVAEVLSLRAALEAAQLMIDDLVDGKPATPPPGDTFNGRPVLSIREAAKRANVGYWTAFGYVQDQWWEAHQKPNKEWVVFADRPLNRKRSRRK
jgi:hypothetical protein